jgi:2-polyprenyl-3-methyl-5-hydroxy-6-metoxy-1,4-benzoquinol methylase
MSSVPAQHFDIDVWLQAVSERIERYAPELRQIYEIYSGEARFGRKFIAPDLAQLPQEKRLLEVGAGSYLLSCQLVREGFDVAALEPVGEGFSHFHRLQEIVTQLATELNCMPRVVAVRGEDLDERDSYNFAFSINVMEHVNDVEAVIDRVMRSLRGGGWYRFTCPNYSFPYEPHFNMPTLFSKQLTERWMARRIFESGVPDAEGTWESLNWISVRQVQRFLRQRPEWGSEFDRHVLTKALERIANDREFAARRPALLRRCIGILVNTNLHRLASVVPQAMLPIINCRIEKLAR